MTNIETVAAFYTALRSSNYAAVSALLDDDFTLQQASSLPYGGEYKGIEGIKTFFQLFFDVWENFSSQHVRYVDLDDHSVLALSQISATTKTGVDLDMPMTQIFRVNDGKLLEARPFYWDTAAIVQAVDK
ncbi:MAG: nuclear transport factor 2 family protein [Deinococcota bacterium]